MAIESRTSRRLQPPSGAVAPTDVVERQRRHALAALARAYRRERDLVRRFAALAHADHEPVLADEVDEVLAARDRALARLEEWSS